MTPSPVTGCSPPPAPWTPPPRTSGVPPPRIISFWSRHLPSILFSPPGKARTFFPPLSLAGWKRSPPSPPSPPHRIFCYTRFSFFKPPLPTPDRNFGRGSFFPPPPWNQFPSFAPRSGVGCRRTHVVLRPSPPGLGPVFYPPPFIPASYLSLPIPGHPWSSSTYSCFFTILPRDNPA